MSKYLFLEYPKCSTCQKAKKWLEENHIKFEPRHIIEQNPTETELKQWILQSQLPIKSFFNTSGLLYKSMELKNKIPQMSEDEQIKLLSTNGMLVKRPLLIGEKSVFTGFKPTQWEELKS